MTTDIEDEILELEAQLDDLEAAEDALRERFHGATTAKVSHDLGDARAARKAVANRMRELKRIVAASAGPAAD